MTESLAEERLRMIEDCEKRDSVLTSWERRFIDSMRHRVESDRPLSEKQTVALDEILERATSKGDRP